jgi:glyoxylase-like metal-dependent hydrolase (beta-lactamase superfamily II)
MRVRFLGNTSCAPDPGTDTSCLLIDDQWMIDTGWAPVPRMLQIGIDPLGIRGIFFTHFLQDHYLGLVQILFLMGLRLPSGGDQPGRHPLIAGPGEHLNTVLKAAREYLQIGRFPQLEVTPRVRPLSPGDDLEIGELHLRVSAARHVSGGGADEPALADVTLRLPDITFDDKEMALQLAGQVLRLIHVPGHTPGGMCLFCESPPGSDQPVLFAGDALFAGSIGRGDFPGGDMDLLVRSIREKLLVLPDDTIVYTGHGPSTTIGQEKKINPFL